MRGATQIRRTSSWREREAACATGTIASFQSESERERAGRDLLRGQGGRTMRLATGEFAPIQIPSHHLATRARRSLLLCLSFVLCAIARLVLHCCASRGRPGIEVAPWRGSLIRTSNCGSWVTLVRKLCFSTCQKCRRCVLAPPPAHAHAVSLYAVLPLTCVCVAAFR